MVEKEIKLEGHIIDSHTLGNTMDLIMDKGGDFDVLEFEIGKHKKDTSHARLRIHAESEELLDSILDELAPMGVSIAETKEVILESAPKDKVAPEGFYSTSHHVTHIYYNGEWILVKEIEMDCLIVVDEETGEAVCKPIANIEKGDLIVMGRDGIKITPPSKPRGKKGVFEFMNSDVSSEKPLMHLINQIASEIKEVKAKGGKIALVGGPAIAHTGSTGIIADMIKEGIIDVIFAGNALATHDIEVDQFGTSLGVNVETGEVVAHGHTHHMRAINRINRSGSIKAAVEDGTLKSGIMYECVKNDVPFVLAGSIRDDGPLPDVITDTVESQTLMRKYTQQIDMVIMIATMLHSIATGNLLPSRVKTICVDINPSTVTKLADRGTAQALGIVTDVGAFLPVLYNALHDDD